MDNINNISNIPKEESIDYKALFFKFYRYWYFFALAIFIFFIIAFLFNKYTEPIYKVNTTVLIQEDKSSMDPQSLLGFGLMGNQQNLENEIGILQSYSLTYRTLKGLDFGISYYIEENFITKELYHISPFDVIIDTAHLQPVNLKFFITILSDKKFKIEAKGEEIELYNFTDYTLSDNEIDNLNFDKTYEFGEQIKSQYYSFKIFLNINYNEEEYKNKDLCFIFNDIESLVKQYSSFAIEPINREASILDISLEGSDVEKSVNFLNKLTMVYLDRGLEKKNKIAINTINFIDSELEGIVDSLTLTEQNLQDYRTANVVMDLDFQAQQVFEYMKELENEKAVLIVKSMYYNNLKDYLQNKSNVDDLVVPSSIGIEDPVLNELISGLTQFYNTRTELLFTSTEKNPMVLSLNKQIQNTKKALIENINNMINTSTIAINDINRRISELSGKINRLPKTQRNLISIQRKFKLN
jgi:uncharacterized protein involved in exopolysaccharide biosynthesis